MNLNFPHFFFRDFVLPKVAKDKVCSTLIMQKKFGFKIKIQIITQHDSIMYLLALYAPPFSIFVTYFSVATFHLKV